MRAIEETDIPKNSQILCIISGPGDPEKLIRGQASLVVVLYRMKGFSECV